MWHGFHGRIIGLAVLVVLIAGSVGVWTVERHSGGPIDSYADASWWSIATITTVGYGDMYPVTPEGRGIATFIMLSGIAIFGVVSANLAALFIRKPERNDQDELLARLDALAAQVAELKASQSDLRD
jgi:voltage-gated potassium channel